jgi:hypothetical protein
MGGWGENNLSIQGPGRKKSKEMEGKKNRELVQRRRMEGGNLLMRA